jgi:hypothetical protein
MITITEQTARIALESLKLMNMLPNKLDSYRKALSELEDQLAGWKDVLSEIPPHRAIGERFVVRLASGIVYKAVLIKCPNNGDDQLFSRLGSHDDDILFTGQVAQWRYDD